MTKPRRKINIALSTELSVEELVASCEQVRELEDELITARAVRDQLIVSAAKHMTTARLSRYTGLSRQMIYRIVPVGMYAEEE